MIRRISACLHAARVLSVLAAAYGGVSGAFSNRKSMYEFVHGFELCAERGARPECEPLLAGNARRDRVCEEASERLRAN
jgi:hypothetical protein